MERVKKKLRCTNRQKAALVHYMTTHPLFAKGELAGPQSQAKATKEWLCLKAMLDQVGPAKPLIAWQRTWRDIKKRARQERTTVLSQSNRTVNSMDRPTVSSISQKVLGVLEGATSNGINGEESPIEEEVIDETFTPSPRSSPLPKVACKPDLNLKKKKLERSEGSRGFDKSKEEVYGDDEFNVFAKHVAMQLRKLPLQVAIDLEGQIQNMVHQARVTALQEQQTNGVSYTISVPFDLGSDPLHH